MSDDRLRLLIERIERINEEIKGLQDDRKDVYAEAKAVGYDAAILRKVIARRAVNPSDRAEADILLEAYEAALGEGPAVELRTPDERVAEIAHALLAEQVAGIEDAAQAALLVEHVTSLLDLRAEIGVLRDAEKDRKALAKGEGFEVKQLAQVVRWLEKCARHGEEAMRAGEAVYLLYRGTVERRPSAADATSDPVLAARLAPPKPKKVTARDRRLAETLAWAGIEGDPSGR